MRWLVLGYLYPTYTEFERIINGLSELMSTIGVTLVGFTLIFSKSLQSRALVKDLEVNGLIPSTEELSPFVVTFDKYLPCIIVCLVSLPSLLLIDNSKRSPDF